MKIKRVAITDAFKVELQDAELDENALGESEILIRSLYSIISAGTEGASFSGLEREHPHPGRTSPFQYPVYPGYGNIGKVVKAGSAVKEFAVDDIVFTTAPHASYSKFNTRSVCVKVPGGLDLKKAVFARMSAVAMTAVRTADFSPGDTVLVLGLGLVGNLAAQEFALAGGNVMAADLSPVRVEKASRCGLKNVVNSGAEDLRAAVERWSGGPGARIVVEAVGQPQLIEEGVHLTRRYGEIILLGSPRQLVTMDVTPMLSRIHIMGITMKGALEWLFPIQDSEPVRHSVVQNVKHIFGWLQEDRLKIEPLLTHVLSPTECQRAYQGLHDHKDEYLGVVFDWTTLES